MIESTYRNKGVSYARALDKLCMPRPINVVGFLTRTRHAIAVSIALAWLSGQLIVIALDLEPDPSLSNVFYASVRKQFKKNQNRHAPAF